MPTRAGANVSIGIPTHLIDPQRRWYNNRRLIALHAWMALLLITASASGYDGSMMNGLQSLDQWESEFHYPSGGKLGLLNSIQTIGMLAGCLFAPYVSDNLGRRRAVWFGAAIMCAAAAIQTAAQSVAMFIGSRFLIGFGFAFAANAAPMLITEISYPTYRAALTSLYNSLWYSGAIIAAWTTYGTFRMKNTWAWRLPSAIQAAPSILQCLLILFAPESPRWLVSKGREEEALKILAYYHADGEVSDPLVQYEFREIKAAFELDRTVAMNVGWKSFIATPGNRKRMRVIVAIAIFSQWSGNGIVSFYLNKVFDQIGITSASTQLLINGILQIWNMGWAVYASFMVDRLGRRFLFLASSGLMTLFYTAQVICFSEYARHGNVVAARGVVGFIFLFYAAYDIAFIPLIVPYTLEILPYDLRAKGFNVSSIVVTVAAIFNQYVNPIALESLGWKYYLIFVCLLICEFIFCWFFIVETKNRTLEETATLFDGEDGLHRMAENMNEKGLCN